MSSGRWSRSPDTKPPTCAGVATSTPWKPASIPVISCKAIHAAIEKVHESQPLGDRNEIGRRHLAAVFGAHADKTLILRRRLA